MRATGLSPGHESLHTELKRLLSAAVQTGVTPSAVCAVAVDGERLPVITVGDAVRFGSDGTELPEQERIPASAETLYDLASVTKVFTAVTALALVDDGVWDLDQTVPVPLGKFGVTLRQLLTHTSGLPGTWDGWRGPLATGAVFDREALLADLLALEPLHQPGTHFEYSCAGFNTIMAAAEQITGKPWLQLVNEKVLSKVDANGGLSFTPDPLCSAATEYQPELGRGMIRGVVHDEAAWSLGGACGNAGLFGTAGALLGFAEFLRAGLPGILSPTLATAMWTDQLRDVLGKFLPTSGAEFGHGLGLRIGQAAWMGSPHARGHNGFTGTSLLVDRDARMSVVLLSNRVHPRREISDFQPVRLAVSDTVYSHLS
ncbi:serine hydrolase domain-containing protein [Pseudarthrobacter sp. J1738]|uniref:serine hydrolase domain-containing protein n=1 Tax=unclassified Pseudarthrobacter TaxID=2647000 RepID=UPI003D2DB6E8